MKLKQLIKKYIPFHLWEWLHSMRNKYAKRKQLLAYQRHYNVVINRLKTKKEPLNVLFMAIYGSNWKFDSVYQMMLEDPMFNPVILVCPDVDRGCEHMLEVMNSCCRMFEQKGYTYVRVYDEKSNTYVDAHSFQPDIIFYTNPYDWLIDSRYYLDKFEDVLTCYANYGYINTNHEFGFNLPFHQQVWHYYVECEDMYQLIKRHSKVRAKNVRIVGFHIYDELKNEKNECDIWKVKDKEVKRIIWSPHHTITNHTDILKLSTFELYFDFMLLLADKYKHQIQFVFKPHPLLKNALYGLDGWGKERTDAYYEKWETGENTAFSEGEYASLFNSSDAMINDSASFTYEYLYERKPCLFLSNYEDQIDRNTSAQRAYDCWYHAITEQQIEDFIKNVVLGGDDPMKAKREAYYNEVLLPPNGRSVAENIINEIKRAVHK